MLGFRELKLMEYITENTSYLYNMYFIDTYSFIYFNVL